jgi:hypothetical protein
LSKEPTQPESHHNPEQPRGTNDETTIKAPRRRLLTLQDIWRVVREWAAEHKGEIIWAVVFAILFAVPAARFLDPLENHPYWVHIVTDRHTDGETKDVFENVAKDWQKDKPTIGVVPVFLDVIYLKDDDVQTKAEELVKAPDTLMVIDYLPSGLTEKSLPIYLGARPQVPYISTIATDDDLLVACKSTPRCYLKDGRYPLIQISPRNVDEGEAAVRYAVQKHKYRFLIVTDDERDQDNKPLPYLTNMYQAYSHGIEGSADKGALFIADYMMGNPPTPEQFKDWNADCILYAGRPGPAQALLNSLAGRDILVILSDSVVVERGTDDNLANFAAARFTYPSDATDYNLHTNVYGRDAVSIARQLINDLDKRGGDPRYRTLSHLNMATVGDARRNLVRIIAENFASRTWYDCESAAGCQFGQKPPHNRSNGMFHVWQLGSKNGGEMLDIDGWHAPRSATTK